MTKKEIIIKNRNGEVLFVFSKENNTLKDTLEEAVRSKTNLRYADLRDADLLEIKEDFIQKLSLQKDEVEGLKVALQNGKVDGSTYAGECACFVGTIANVKKCNYNDLMVKPNSNSPIERWFLGIKKGDTPETNIISKITVEWINEFQKNT
jgi:hypothetical protein